MGDPETGPERRPPQDLWVYERGLWAAGYALVAGVDEAGRGPLAGPVVAAAVILPRTFRHRHLKDSKQLTPRLREELAPHIRKSALSWSVASADEREIESLNILQATLLAMRRAVEGLERRPDHLLVDALRIPGVDVPQLPVVRGDRLSASAAAASILAKVERDGIMAEYHVRYPLYGFDRHKGYGTAAHRFAIATHGPCEAHRRTFRGVAEYVGRNTP